MTTLLPIPGAPGYRIDLDKQQAYSLKRGCIRPMKPRTKYKCVSLSVDGTVIGSTIYRMMYCAQHGIDINRLPSDVCFSMENGVVVPMTREQVVEKTNRARQKAKPKMERLQRNRLYSPKRETVCHRRERTPSPRNAVRLHRKYATHQNLRGNGKTTLYVNVKPTHDFHGLARKSFPSFSVGH